MEKKKELIESKLKKVEEINEVQNGSDESMKSSSDTDSDNDDDEIPEYIDWRAKKSHK
jgi:hypothetical protein